jgi:hypothetical protein
MPTYQIITNATLSFAVTEICKLVGYPVSSDPAGSTDLGIQQMIAAVNQNNGELYAMRDWQELRIPLNIDVVADFANQPEKAFDLPPQYGRFVDNTHWCVSQKVPAIGPISPQAWAGLLQMPVAPTFQLMWQIRNDQIWFLAPNFPDIQPFTAMYISRGSITDQDDPTIIKNLASKNGDTFLLDPGLIILGGRVKWLEYKGFDTSSAMRDFQTQYDSRAGSDEGATVYSLNSYRGLPLISPLNLPQTGYGQ